MSLVLVVGAAALTIHHVMGHRHFVAIPLLLVPGLVLGVTEYQFREDVGLFSTIASQIAGRRVTVHCQRLSGALVDATSELGYVEFDANGKPSDVAHLERDTCNNLRAYVHGDKTAPTIDQVIAVNVLDHEAHHLTGVLDEAQTECASIQQLAEVATWLGATWPQADALTERYITEVYPRMADNYRSADCLMDGPWDLSPGDQRWP